MVRSFEGLSNTENGIRWTAHTISKGNIYCFGEPNQPGHENTVWALRLRYVVEDETGQRTFRPVADPVVTIARAGDGSDLLPLISFKENKQYYHEKWESYPIRPKPGEKQSAAFGKVKWPPRFDGTIDLSMNRLLRNIARLKGYCDFKVVAATHIVELGSNELNQWNEVGKGLRVRLVSEVTSGQHRSHVIEYERTPDAKGECDRVNAVEARDENGNILEAVVVRTSIRPELSPIPDSGRLKPFLSTRITKSSVFRIDVIGTETDVRIHFDLVDIPLWEAAPSE